MTPTIPPGLMQMSRDLDLALKTWITVNYPKYLVLRWIAGPYKGRLCRVRHSIYINEPDGSMTIGLRVETRRHNDAGFVNGNDGFHRTYHDANYFFEKYDLKGYDTDSSGLSAEEKEASFGEDIG